MKEIDDNMIQELVKEVRFMPFILITSMRDHQLPPFPEGGDYRAIEGIGASEDALRHCFLIERYSAALRTIADQSLHPHESYKLPGEASDLECAVITDKILMLRLDLVNILRRQIFAATGHAYAHAEIFRGGVVAVKKEEFEIHNAASKVERVPRYRMPGFFQLLGGLFKNK